MLRHLSIRNRLVIAVVLSCTVLIAACATLIARAGVATLTRTAQENIVATNQAKLAVIRAWSQTQMQALDKLRYEPAIVEAATVLTSGPADPAAKAAAHERVSSWFETVNALSAGDLHAMLLDKRSGRVLVALPPGDEGKTMRSRSYFAQAQSHAAVFPAYFDMAAAEMIVPAAGPVGPRPDEAPAIVVIEPDLTVLDAAIRQRSTRAASGHSYLLDRSNMFLSGLPVLEGPAQTAAGNFSSFAKACMAGVSGVEQGLDYRGIPVLAAIDWLPLEQACLVTQIDMDEVVAPAIELRNQILMIGAAGLIFGAGFASLIGTRLVRPLAALAEGVAVLRDGNLSSRIAVPDGADPETRSLGTLINDMASSLQKAQERVEQRDAQLRLVTNHIGDIVAQIDETGTYRYVTPSIRTVLGFAEEDVVGKHTSAIRAMLNLKDISQTIFADHILWTGRVTKADGTEAWLETVRKEVHHKLDGEDRTTIVDVTRDVTARVMQEAEIKTQAEVFGILTRNAKDMITIRDEEGRFVFLSPSVAVLTGHAVEDLIGRRWQDVFAAVEMSGPAPDQVEPGQIYRLRMRHRDGHDVWIESVISEYERDVGGRRTTQRLAVSRDVTHQITIEEELRTARVEADRANMAKSEFLTRMSHELRTPLNAIIGFSQLLELDVRAPLTREQLEQVSYISRGGRHLLHLINEVLDLARIESGGLRMSVEQVGCQDLLAECAEMLEPLADKADVALSIEGDAAAVPPVKGDRTRIMQILINLGSNAIKYNRPGGSVTLSARLRPEGGVRFSVSDTGIGIAPTYREQVFVPFERLGAEHRGIEGTGVGLSITRRLAEMMGGTIDFSSTPGVGSIFWVDLPVASAKFVPFVPEVVEPARRYDADPAEFDILYIEDNESNQALVGRIVGTIPGARLDCRSTAEDGLVAAVSHAPSVILMDIHLPGMDGFEALQRLRADPRTWSIPVIALTASAVPKEVQRGLDAGFDAYITKPIDVPQLVNAVLAAALNGRQMERSAGGKAAKA